MISHSKIRQNILHSIVTKFWIFYLQYFQKENIKTEIG